MRRTDEGSSLLEPLCISPPPLPPSRHPSCPFVPIPTGGGGPISQRGCAVLPPPFHPIPSRFLPLDFPPGFQAPLARLHTNCSLNPKRRNADVIFFSFPFYFPFFFLVGCHGNHPSAAPHSEGGCGRGGIVGMERGPRWAPKGSGMGGDAELPSDAVLRPRPQWGHPKD